MIFVADRAPCSRRPHIQLAVKRVVFHFADDSIGFLSLDRNLAVLLPEQNKKKTTKLHQFKWQSNANNKIDKILANEFNPAACNAHNSIPVAIDTEISL